MEALKDEIERRVFRPSWLRLVLLWGGGGGVGWSIARVLLGPSVPIWWALIALAAGAIAGLRNRDRFAVALTAGGIEGPGSINRRRHITFGEIDTERTRRQQGLEALLSSHLVWSRDGSFVRIVRRYFDSNARKNLIGAIDDAAAQANGARSP